jgi:heme/copper-type cytochrome/quinol oxidase subunit 2
MMPEPAADTNSKQIDADQLARLLELELMQKRAQWKQASSRRRSMRTMAFAFIFVLVAASLVGFFFVFTRVNEERANQQNSTTTAVPDR